MKVSGIVNLLGNLETRPRSLLSTSSHYDNIIIIGPQKYSNDIVLVALITNNLPSWQWCGSRSAPWASCMPHQNLGVCCIGRATLPLVSVQCSDVGPPLDITQWPYTDTSLCNNHNKLHMPHEHKITNNIQYTPQSI